MIMDRIFGKDEGRREVSDGCAFVAICPDDAGGWGVLARRGEDATDMMRRKGGILDRGPHMPEPAGKTGHTSAMRDAVSRQGCYTNFKIITTDKKD